MCDLFSSNILKYTLLCAEDMIRLKEMRHAAVYGVMLVGPPCVSLEPERTSECDMMLTVNNCGRTVDER